MRLLRLGKGREAIFQNVVDEMGAKSVLELCSGPGELAQRIRPEQYAGIDLNPSFVHRLRDKGWAVTEGDVMNTPWPPAECLVMIDSLYHFYDRMDEFMNRVAAHPCGTVILSEPVENLLPRLPAGFHTIGAWVTRVEGHRYPKRFTEATLRALLERYGFQKITRVDTNCTGVWKKHG
jgi:hypothetical protein